MLQKVARATPNDDSYLLTPPPSLEVRKLRLRDGWSKVTGAAGGRTCLSNRPGPPLHSGEEALGVSELGGGGGSVRAGLGEGRGADPRGGDPDWSKGNK